MRIIVPLCGIQCKLLCGCWNFTPQWATLTIITHTPRAPHNSGRAINAAAFAVCMWINYECRHDTLQSTECPSMGALHNRCEIIGDKSYRESTKMTDSGSVLSWITCSSRYHMLHKYLHDIKLIIYMIWEPAILQSPSHMAITFNNFSSSLSFQAIIPFNLIIHFNASSCHYCCCCRRCCCGSICKCNFCHPKPKQ